MAITASPRLGITRWSAEADVQSRAQFDADHAALDLLAARDEQGTALARPAPAIRGRYYFATDTHELSRDDGATYWKVSLTDVQTDRSAGMSISTDGAAAGSGSGYSPLVISRNNSTAPYLTLNSTAVSTPRWAIGIYGTSLAFGTGPSTSGTWATNPLFLITNTGGLSAKGQASIGTYSQAPTGTAISLGDRGSTTAAYLGATGDLASVGLILQGQGVAGSVSLQPNATNNVVVATPTSLTISQATAITAGGLDVTGSPTGYEAEVRAPITSPTSPTFALSTLATGSPSINMDHRGAGNTGQWLWRNGTSAGTTRMTLTNAGHLLLTADVTTSLASGALTSGLSLWGTGLVYQADSVAVQGGVTAGIAVAINRAAPALTITNGGGDTLQLYGSGYALREQHRLDGTVTQTVAGGGAIGAHGFEVLASPNTGGWAAFYLHTNWGLGLGGDPFRLANSTNDLFRIDSYGRLVWPNASTNGLASASASAGGAGALPATPLGYLQMLVNGTTVKVPYYNI